MTSIKSYIIYLEVLQSLVTYCDFFYERFNPRAFSAPELWNYFWITKILWYQKYYNITLYFLHLLPDVQIITRWLYYDNVGQAWGKHMWQSSSYFPCHSLKIDLKYNSKLASVQNNWKWSVENGPYFKRNSVCHTN